MTRAALTAVLFVVFAAPAWASDGGAAARARPGRVLFEQAEAKFNVGRFDEALVDYQAAYDAEPLPAFLFNIGQCYRNMGNYERAQFFFRRYTALDPRSPNRPAAERLIAEMDKLAAERAVEPVGNRAAATPSFAAPPPAPAADRQAATAGPMVSVADKGAERNERRPIYRRTWFWVAVSAVVVAGGVATAFAVAQDDPRSSLRPIDTR
jgi:tetratricopeptide (TPR) repeat protein